jgi:hypothetical protein
MSLDRVVDTVLDSASQEYSHIRRQLSHTHSVNFFTRMPQDSRLMSGYICHSKCETYRF